MPIKLLGLLIAMFAIPHNGFADQPYQSHESIYQTVTNFIADNLGADKDYDVKISPLDSRLRLPACDDGPTAFTAHNETLRAGRFSVGVRCAGTQSWSIFTTGTLKIFQEVLVLTQPIKRGQVLTRQVLALEKRDQANLRGGHYNQVALVENKQAVRNLPAGAVIGYDNVTDAVLIKRGEKITISASSTGYDVRMQGKALMDGVKDQSIRVKNESSGRTIAATVVRSGLVSVNP